MSIMCDSTYIKIYVKCEVICRQKADWWLSEEVWVGASKGEREGERKLVG